LVLFVSGHPDVSVLSPAGSPRVLDDPIVSSAGIVTPTNSQHSVVQLRSRAGGLVVDSRRVELERGLRSVDGNGSGSLGDGLLELVLVSGGNVLVSLQSGSRVGSVVLAVSVFSGVRIRGFGIDSLVVDDVLHGLGHQTSFASHVSFRGRAIDEVLLRERNEFLGGEEMASLSRSSGRERPARTTLSLILDSSNGSLGSPIERSGEGRYFKFLTGVLSISGDFDSEVELSEFSVGEVSQVVHGQLHSVVLGIDSVDVSLVSLEDGISVLEFFVIVRSSVLLHPLNEKSLVVLFRSEGKSAGKEESDEDDGLHC